MGRRKRLELQDITITDVGAKGKGIAKTEEGKVLFVAKTVTGDNINFISTKKRRNYTEGIATSFNSYSEHRVKEKCKHFGLCGGCKWQHINYDHQLEIKQKIAEDAIQKIGGVEDALFEPIIAAEEVFYYRNKMEFSFSDNRWLTEEEIENKEENIQRNGLGFHLPGRWDRILHIKECLLQDDFSNQIRNFVFDYASENDLKFFNPRSQDGLLRNLMIRNTTIGQWMVLFQFKENKEEEITNLLNALKNQFSEITSLLYVINDKPNDTIYDLEIKTFFGKDYIEENLGGYIFKIRAKSFFQTNTKQAFKLYSLVEELAELNRDEVVYDLYCGTGSIGIFVAKNTQKVIGIESVADAITDAKENAKRNCIDNISFEVGDMKNAFNQSLIEKYGKPDVLIVDPPRDGMHPKVVEQILKFSPKKIVYVSCKPSTQGRDVAILKQNYKVIKSQPVDLFPHTFHVENVVLLTRKD